MAIHWQVRFMSLRAETVYTVNIYDETFSGTPVQLTGAAQPFETQEDTDDDMFKPVRTQSGYIRIVDTGDINWRDIIPMTDTDRPVTLTHVEGSSTVTDWIGFMQAQNFGARLFETPLEREFPIQCPLTVLSCEDVSTTAKDIRNFAYLLWSSLNTVPATGRPNTFVVQGGEDAREWLKKKFDWFDFIEEGKNHSPRARHDLGEVLEAMCQYWGWTARVMGTTMYLTAADDQSELTALVLTYNDLATLAAGQDAGTIEPMYSTTAIGDIFASTENTDYQNRGANKAIVKVDTHEASDINIFDAELTKEMNRCEWWEGTTYNDDDKYWHYTKDVVLSERLDLAAFAVKQAPTVQEPSGYYAASFNILSKQSTNSSGSGYTEVGGVIRFSKTYNGQIYAGIQTIYEHCFSNGFFRLYADTYRFGEKYENGRFFAGNPAMKMRLGVGNSRETARWWDGRAWQSTMCEYLCTIGNQKPELFTRYEIGSGFDLEYEESSIILTESHMYGRLYIDFLGTDDNRVDDFQGEKSFDLKGFKVQFTKNDTATKTQYPNSGYWVVKENDEFPEMEYEAKNDSVVREDYSIDSDFGGNDQVKAGYGILMNADGSWMETVNYGSNAERPEQHLANRIVNYWTSSRRRIECELLVHDGTSATVAEDVSPRKMVKVDGTTMYPVAISRSWRDDTMRLSMLETLEPPVMLVLNAAHTNLGIGSTTINIGQRYQTAITADAGYVLGTVTVLMGGEDITSTAYSAGQISISSVTGDVTITATTTSSTMTAAFFSRVTAGGATLGNDKALISAIQGSTLVYNQFRPDLLSPTTYGNYNLDWDGGDQIVMDNFQITTSTQNFIIEINPSRVAGHVYYIGLQVYPDTDTTQTLARCGLGWTASGASGIDGSDYNTGRNKNSWTTLHFVSSPSGSSQAVVKFVVRNANTGIRRWLTENTKVYVKNFRIIDLTLMFGAGNEPSTPAEFEALFPLMYNTYSDGSPLNNTMSALVSKDSEDNILQTAVVPIKTLMGRLDGEGALTTIFPSGMKSSGNVRDEIVLEDGVWKAYKRVGDTWSNNSYNLLSETEEYVIETTIDSEVTVATGGTESILPVNGETPETSMPIITMHYGL